MIKSQNSEYVHGSFRGPSGYLFYKNGSIYRQINNVYKDNYNHLINSGLYEKLIECQLLIPYEEVDIQSPKIQIILWRHDTVFALALIHHLAISNNLPIRKIANFFSFICKYLIIEFVPKDDPQVQRLLSKREDIFADYTRGDFENEFDRYFVIKRTEKIIDSKRILYLMQKR